MSYTFTIAIRRSKRKLIKLCLLCVLFILLGIWHLIPNPSFDNRYFADNTIREGIGFSLLLVFGPFIIYPAYKLFDTTPALTINEDGLIDNSSAIAMGVIPWEDIDLFVATKQSNAKFITVSLFNLHKFIDREKSSLKR